VARPWTWLAAASILLAGCATAAGKGPTIVAAPTTTTATSAVELTAPTTLGVTETPDSSISPLTRPEITDNRVYLVGDSIAESVGPRYSGTVCDALEPLGWNVTVDAVMGRNTGQAVQSMRAHRSSVGQVLVVLIGHNDGIDPAAYHDNLTRLLAAAPNARWILLLTNYEFERGRNRMNLILYALAASDERIQVVDWNSVVKGTKGAIRGDGLHLTAVGEKALAETIAEALGTAPPAAPGKTNNTTCTTYRNPNPTTSRGSGGSSGRTSTTSASTVGSGPPGTDSGAPVTDAPSATHAPSTDAPPTAAASTNPAPTQPPTST
jgi:lysophospholipase L1-like esterase/predicted small secreted protein